MKNYCKIFVILLSITSCALNTNQELSLNSESTYDSERVYKRGEFTTVDGVFYQATTSVKGRSPRQNVSSRTTPMNPWRISSEKAYQDATQPSIPVILEWKVGQVYHANDVVVRENLYYKAMWWNQNNDPVEAANKNAFVDSASVTHWGPWVSITREVAEEGATIPIPDITPPTTPDITPPTTTPEIEGVLPGGGNGGNVNVDEAQQYEWSKVAVYTENMVAIANNKYYRAKWWNQNNNPNTPYDNAWDSPWQEITEERFMQIINGVNPPNPPVVQPPTIDPSLPTPDITPPSVDPQYEEIVTQGFIKEWHWDDADVPLGVKEAFNAAAVVTGNIFAVQNGQEALDLFEAQINADKWEQLFPRRRGSVGWKANNVGQNPGDYYSFDNFSKAMLIVGEYAYMRDVALDSNTDVNGSETSFERNYILHKPTKKIRLISQSADYFSADPSWLTSRIHRKKVVDYAAFGREGSNNDKKRVVAGFLAHASHETSGSWATAPDYTFNKSLFAGATFPNYITDRLPGELAWSLYFNEEVAFAGATDSHYKDPNNKIFPPTPGQSYHGRGAFQLTWNYNYGLASAIFFGDSNVLLDNANMIMTGGTIPNNTSSTGTWRAGETIEGGTIAFLTSLMFWLTPQGTKPSQQDTMILNRTDGRYVSGLSKVNEDPGLGEPGYGWTINIMNGGYEANKSWEPTRPNYDAKVARRVKHYLFFTQALGGNNTGEVLDTYGNHSY